MEDEEEERIEAGVRGRSGRGLTAGEKWQKKVVEAAKRERSKKTGFELGGKNEEHCVCGGVGGVIDTLCQSFSPGSFSLFVTLLLIRCSNKRKK